MAGPRQEATMASSSQNGAALRALLENYRDLNPSTTDILLETPTALEFMRYVARNRPFVVRGGAAEWRATRDWDVEYLKDRMGNARINVAITPSGNADSIVEQKVPGGNTSRRLYVEPLEREMPFGEVLDYIRAQDMDGTHGAVLYAQSQNDCLRDEYKDLFSDVPGNIDFARIALQQEGPDAVNFWLGNSRSTSALHRDNYENLFAQIRGSKRFLLLPPVTVAVVGEQDCIRTRYAVGQTPLLAELGADDFHFVTEKPEILTPIPTWDPDVMLAEPGSLRELIQPFDVTLNQGDMLYLPALWYHKVSQIAGPQGFCCSVNYW